MAAPHQDSRGIAVRDTTTGQVGYIPPENAERAFASGNFAPVTTDELAAYDRQKELQGPLSTAAAFLGGGASGFTFGASDVLLGALAPETAAELEERRKASPIADVAGEVVGGVVGALIPGAPLARAGAAAERLAGGGARALLARGAVEGGLIGGGTAVSEIARSPETLTAEQVASKIAAGAGGGAALGGLTTLGFMGLGAVAKAGKKLATRAMKVGEKPTKVADAAERLARYQQETLASEPIARRAQLQAELESATDIARELKRRGEASVLSDVRLRQKALKTELKRLDDEILNLDKISAVGKVQTTTRQRETISKVAEKIRSGEKLDAADSLAALREQQATVIANENNINVAIAELRNDTRRALRVGDDVSRRAEEYAQYLEEGREILRAKKRALSSDITRIREGEAITQARTIKSTIDTIQRETRTVNPIKKAEALLARDEALQRTALDIPDGVLNEMRSMKTRGDIAQFMSWRSASTLLGLALGDLPGALMGAALGARGGTVLSSLLERTMPTLSMAGPVAKYIGRGARTAAVESVMSPAEIRALVPAIAAPSNDPEQIYADMYSGYSQGGLDAQSSQTVATMQAGRALAMREAVPMDMRSTRQRKVFSDVVASAADPRRIAPRIEDKSVSEGDMRVLDAMFPEAAAEVRALGRRLLDESDESLSSRDRAFLETLARGRPETAQRTAAILASARENDTQQAKPSAKMIEPWTASQRLME